MILILASQAGIDLKTKRKLFATLEGNNDGVEELEVMGLKHFILPFTFLGIGIVLSMVVWIIELGIKHMGKSNRVAVDVDVAEVNNAEVDVDNDVNIVDVNADIDVDMDVYVGDADADVEDAENVGDIAVITQDLT